MVIADLALPACPHNPVCNLGFKNYHLMKIKTIKRLSTLSFFLIFSSLWFLLAEEALGPLNAGTIDKVNLETSAEQDHTAYFTEEEKKHLEGVSTTQAVAASYQPGYLHYFLSIFNPYRF